MPVGVTHDRMIFAPGIMCDLGLTFRRNGALAGANVQFSMLEIEVCSLASELFRIFLLNVMSVFEETCEAL